MKETKQELILIISILVILVGSGFIASLFNKGNQKTNTSIDDITGFSSKIKKCYYMDKANRIWVCEEK